LHVFRAELQFIKYASEHSVPSDSDKQKLLLPTSKKIQEIQTLREKNRGSPFFNHLSAISESIPALGWVAVVSNRLINSYIILCDIAFTFFSVSYTCSLH